MKHKLLTLFVLVLTLLFIFTGCQAAGENGGVPAVNDTPVEVTENFYDWYFDYIGEPGTEGRNNPLVDRAYQSSPYLTAAYVAEVDTILTGFDQGGYDPFLQAQDIPQSYTVEEDFTAENEACVIVHEQWDGSPSHDLTIDLVKEDGAWKINNIRAGNPRTPEGVTRLFYDWYLDYARNQGNPLVDGAYKTSPYLSSGFIGQVDETLASFVDCAYDPILLAQDIPAGFFIELPVVNGSQASVVMQRYWGGNPTPTPMTVHLELVGSHWQIVNVSTDETIAEIANPAAVYCKERGFTYEIRTNEDGSQSGVCILTDGTECDDWAFFRGNCPASSPDTPAAVVQAFYDWYLAYIGDPATEEFRNPLVDKAYQQSEYLTAGFITYVDELLAGFEGGGYDPFLCAQAVPDEIQTGVVFMNGETPGVIVSSSFPNQVITVDLQQVGQQWQISNITCGNTPTGMAKAFYTWYLGYMGDRASGEFRNPLVDGAYRDTLFLTDDLVQRVDETLASFSQGGFDPFLLAQDIPQSFSINPGPVENTAVVHLQFGPDSVRHLLLTFADTYPPRIDKIEEAAVSFDFSGWQTVMDIRR